MATCNGNGAAKFSSKLQVEAIQTVIPMKITDPRLSRRIAVSENFCSGDLQRRFHMVLYYNKASETDSGWIVAGWFKESLGMAIVESPLVGGRLRKLEDNNDLELVSNDSGVRLVEANVQINMADFIDLKNKENLESELVFWEDIHETNPQFSPLFYVQRAFAKSLKKITILLQQEKIQHNILEIGSHVYELPAYYVGTPTREKLQQNILEIGAHVYELPAYYAEPVTNFKCGGYSIGISCSLFVADPFVMTSFLKNWSKIHNNLTSQIDAPKIPAFYTPNLRKVGFLPTISTSLTTRNQTTQTLIFKIPKNPSNLNKNFLKNLASKCIGELEEKLGKKLSSKFTLFVKESTKSENVIKVETCNKEEVIKEECGLITKSSGLISASWDDLGGDKVSFNEGNKAVNISCWIINAENQDLVMITPSPEEDGSQLNIIITVTN